MDMNGTIWDVKAIVTITAFFPQPKKYAIVALNDTYGEIQKPWCAINGDIKVSSRGDTHAAHSTSNNDF